jgi:thioredoxin 1
MGNLIELEGKESLSVLKEKGVVIIDFHAPWCGPCRNLSPILDELASDNSDNLKIIKIDVDENTEIAREYGVRSIPSVMIFKDGVEVNKFIGLKTKTEIQNIIDSFLN